MSIKIHKRDGISYTQNSDLTVECRELFALFNLADTCPYFPDEGHLSLQRELNTQSARKRVWLGGFLR